MIANDEQEQQPLATVPPRTPIELGPRGIQIGTLAELGRFAEIVIESGLAPESLDTKAKVILALEMGMELGFRPMMALQNIGVINGRAGIYGDAAKALCEASGLLADYDQRFEGSIEAGDRKCVVTTWRKGRKHPITTEYGMADAKRADLWEGKRGGSKSPWVTAPDRMMMFRARGFNLRDNFPDVMKGFRTYEELSDYVDLADEETRARRAKPAKILEPRFPAEPSPVPPPPSQKKEEKKQAEKDDIQKTFFKEEPAAKKPATAPPAAATASQAPEQRTGRMADAGRTEAPQRKLTPYVELKRLLLENERTPEDFVRLCVEREAIPAPIPFDELDEDLVRYALDHFENVAKAL